MWNWDFYVFDSRDYPLKKFCHICTDQLMLLWGVALKIPSSSIQSLIALLSRYLKLSSWFSCFDPANLQRRTTQLADFWRNHQSQTCTVFGSILISLAWTVHNRSQNCAVLRRLVILDYDLWLHRWPASGWLQIWWSAMSTLGSPTLSESKVHMLTSLTPKSLDAFQWMWGWSRMIWLRYPLVNDEPMIWWHYQATAMMGPPLVVAGFVWKLITWGEGMLESARGLLRTKVACYMARNRQTWGTAIQLARWDNTGECSMDFFFEENQVASPCLTLCCILLYCLESFVDLMKTDLSPCPQRCWYRHIANNMQNASISLFSMWRVFGSDRHGM